MKDNTMLVCGKIVHAASTTDTGKIVLGGGVRLPVKTSDTGKITLGGGVRLPVKSA